MWLQKTGLCLAIMMASSSLLAEKTLFASAPKGKAIQETVALHSDNVPVSKISLEQIMADPDWMGNPPRDFVWSNNGETIYYSQKAAGHSHRRYRQINLKEHLSDEQVGIGKESDELALLSQKASKNADRSEGVFIYQGDIYWVDYQSGNIQALTADDKKQSNVRFVNENKISFFEGHKIFMRYLDTGLIEEIADFQFTDDPGEEVGQSYLERSQSRLLRAVQLKKMEDNFQKYRNNTIKQHKRKTWYFDEQLAIKTFEMSPDSRWLVLGLINKALAGKADYLSEFITESGYAHNRKVRSLVGTSKPLSEQFYLIDLVQHQKYLIDISSLPGVSDDPLFEQKRRIAKQKGRSYQEQEGPRAVYANGGSSAGIKWAKNSRKVALMLYAYDNKDRWIATLDIEKKVLRPFHWLSDEAWVNDVSFTDFGWLADNKTLYYLSEEDGYSHIYIKKSKRRARQVTEGQFEVSDVTVSQDGRYFYFKANIKHPSVYEIYRVRTSGGKPQALTSLGGVNDYVLSPMQDHLLIKHSTTITKPELYLLALDNKSPPVRLTDTASEAFKKMRWHRPQIIAVPSTQTNAPIYARLYAAQSGAKDGVDKKKPAVIFVHGSGYLQNSHAGWSYYFREFMFHQFLTGQGYVVLDMDYRASKGYGRDWRTAIYRNMGEPELQDLKDGVNWLVNNANVDLKRIGIYGGSYGGFMTLMALFKAPELFAAGAALRPVTDWAHYSHGYTSNILNTPDIDPEAFEKSSPIEFAEGLNKPLLICHGMVDDNVFFKDTVRLVQRLIELEKTDYFETAIYPVEPHSFKQASSWLDEYKRIYSLFEKHLN